MERHNHKWSSESYLKPFKPTTDQDWKTVKNNFYVPTWWEPVWENHSSETIISSSVDSLYGKITQVEQVPLMRSQVVWEDHSSGTSFPDKKTACLRKLIKRIIHHSSSASVNYSQMSIISIKATGKCVVYKLRSIVITSF